MFSFLKSKKSTPQTATTNSPSVSTTQQQQQTADGASQSASKQATTDHDEGKSAANEPLTTEITLGQHHLVFEDGTWNLQSDALAAAAARESALRAEVAALKKEMEELKQKHRRELEQVTAQVAQTKQASEQQRAKLVQLESEKLELMKMQDKTAFKQKVLSALCVMSVIEYNTLCAEAGITHDDAAAAANDNTANTAGAGGATATAPGTAATTTATA
eukprot:TRINITY_DN78854_c0_g1_i1.p2 TRINITY_DN78854_c0_g1~~TRINITY_DN78854_c0_g1_i1.p2  ORF type:complete len:226 (-),score=130.26 TRINITY_DN78854_c0_g1_i1:106-759(-)